MNEPMVSDSNSGSEQIISLLVPMSDSKLILPTVSVAEMIPYQAPRIQQNMTIKDIPEWYLGNLVWRGTVVPMISYEILNGEATTNIHSDSQLLILNNTGKTTKMPFFCIVTQGIPRLCRVTADEIIENETASTKPYESLAVFVAGEAAIIPDISGLEVTTASLLGYV
ncbi:MAG: chemosensory pili system protein ChpC [Cellvibrionaceae bacterium]|jgi:chemosensory pili system protein ChpC